MDEVRLKHSYTVAIKMVEIGKKRNLTEEQVDMVRILFRTKAVLGW